MTYSGQRPIVAGLVLRWTHWSRDGIPCKSLVKTEGGQEGNPIDTGEKRRYFGDNLFLYFFMEVNIGRNSF